MKTIASVATQGRPGSAYKTWITAYHLYYSQDGELWTPYSESGDSEHSEVSPEVCFAACIFTRRHAEICISRHLHWPAIVNHGHDLNENRDKISFSSAFKPRFP